MFSDEMMTALLERKQSYIGPPTLSWFVGICAPHTPENTFQQIVLE